MDINSINENEESNIFQPLLSINDNFNLSINKNDFNFLQSHDIKCNISSLPFIKPPKIEELDNSNFKEIKDINQISDIISKETSNNTKNILQKKRNRELNEQGTKGNIDIYTKTSLLCKVKKIIFDSLLKYDNYIISKMYNNNIGNGITIKKLFKTNHYQIKCASTEFNKELLKKTQGQIFSSSITTKFTNYPLDHNKQLIEKLLNEKNEERKEIFINLFNKTLLECIEHLIGKKEYKSLKGLEKFYQNEIQKKKIDKENKELLINVINKFEHIINEKKPRNKKTKKKN